MRTIRPRVALIGFEEAEGVALGVMCGDSRPAWNWSAYCSDYSVNETDLAVAYGWDVDEPGVPCHLMAIAPVGLGKGSLRGPGGKAIAFRLLETRWNNTERELSVPEQCPEQYKMLATELARDLADSEQAPPILRRRSDTYTQAQVLVQTTSGHAVALRAEVKPEGPPSDEEGPSHIVLALPDGADPAPWFRAFMEDVHEIDPQSVPHPPPRLAALGDWHTPDEHRVARRIQQIADERDQLEQEEASLEAELAKEGKRADAGPRRAIWEDGDELVAAIEDILCEFGFDVRNMDAETPTGAPKREDLRLTHPDLAGWEALVEVKGYSGGTRTNDAQQIARFQKNYIQETGRQPDLTLWIANTHRHTEPSARPAPDDNVRSAAAHIDAVHVQATDLYRLWALVADSRLDPADVVRELHSAAPGLWAPSALA